MQPVKDTPGFEDEYWPVTAQSQRGLSLHQYYNRTRYWVAGSDDVTQTFRCADNRIVAEQSIRVVRATMRRSSG